MWVSSTTSYVSLQKGPCLFLFMLFHTLTMYLEHCMHSTIQCEQDLGGPDVRIWPWKMHRTSCGGEDWIKEGRTPVDTWERCEYEAAWNMLSVKNLSHFFKWGVYLDDIRVCRHVRTQLILNAMSFNTRRPTELNLFNLTTNFLVQENTWGNLNRIT